MAQKYIEKPLIVIGKKFDVRQWVLVSSIHPLIIWMYREPYCRFTSQDYDPNKVRNKFAHLCNACVNNQNPESAGQVVTEGEHKIVHNMWDSSQFSAYLKDTYGFEKTGLNDPWEEKIWP